MVVMGVVAAVGPMDMMGSMSVVVVVVGDLAVVVVVPQEVMLRQ